jgi:hypothetical protein
MIAASADLAPALRPRLLADLRAEEPASVRGAIASAFPGSVGLPMLLVSGAGGLPREAGGPVVPHGAASCVIPEGGDWLPCGRAWQACVMAVHRWAVRGLPDSALELYAEAMAERDREND